MKFIAHKTLKISGPFKSVLDYLHECKDATFDWTTSLPISAPTQKIKRAGMAAFLNDNLHSYNNSDIKEQILELIVSYFNRKSITCSKEHIKIRYSSFDVLAD